MKLKLIVNCIAIKFGNSISSLNSIQSFKLISLLQMKSSAKLLNRGGTLYLDAGLCTCSQSRFSYYTGDAAVQALSASGDTDSNTTI